MTGPQVPGGWAAAPRTSPAPDPTAPKVDPAAEPTAPKAAPVAEPSAPKVGPAANPAAPREPAAPRVSPAVDSAFPRSATAAPAAPRSATAGEPFPPRGSASPSGEPGRRASSAHEPGATVLPEARVRRPALPGPTTRPGGATGRRPGSARTRKARLAVKRIDPWSVFLFSLLASLFAGVALVVAVAALYSVLGSLGVVASVNELFGEVTGEGEPLFTTKRFVGGAAVLGAVNVVLLTLLATLSALLYNLCASFTGGIEVTLGERD